MQLRWIEGMDAHGGGAEGPKLQVPCGRATPPDSLLPGVIWYTCEPRNVENPIIAIKDKTTEMEETPK